MFYLECGCDTYGASSDLCSLNGVCACRTGYSNHKCSECQDKYYREGNFCVGKSFCFCGFFKKHMTKSCLPSRWPTLHPWN